jgi:DNA-binding HxlR family transcriptional regulator
LSVSTPTAPDEGTLRHAPLERSRGSQTDERLFGDLLDRFAVLAESCFRFSQDVYRRTGAPPGENLDETVRKNLSLARRLFGERHLEILAVLALMQPVRLDDLQEILGGFSEEMLSERLRSLVTAGLVQREEAYGRIESARYALTHKGTIIAHLGEPVFLYLRLAEGWTGSASEEAPAGDADAGDDSGEPRASARVE